MNELFNHNSKPEDFLSNIKLVICECILKQKEKCMSCNALNFYNLCAQT